MAEQEQLVCFLVAPFGQKEQQLGGGTVGTFELIRSAVKEIVESFPDITIKLKRADEIVDVGSVAETFIAALFKADIVIADLSAVMNANVFYELGIRYALKRGITIPVWQKNTKLPADLHGILGVEYEGQNPLASREQFYQFLRQRLKSQQADSPVYRVLPSLEIMQAEEVAHLRSEIQSLRTQVSQVLLNESVQVLLNEAEVLANKEDTKTAIEKLKLAYSAVPQNLTVTLRFGQLLSKVKRHDEAISILHNAVRIAAQSGGPFYSLPRARNGIQEIWKCSACCRLASKSSGRRSIGQRCPWNHRRSLQRCFGDRQSNRCVPERF